MPLIFLLLDDARTLLRWLHVVAAMVWVGSAFALARLDLACGPAKAIPGAKPSAARRRWLSFFARRAGGPRRAPLNFKWEAYATWAQRLRANLPHFLRVAQTLPDRSAIVDAPGWAANALALALLPLAWLAY